MQIANDSDIPVELTSEYREGKLRVPETVTLYPGKTVSFPVCAISDGLDSTETVALPFTIQNFYIAPEEGMPYRLSLTLTFAASDQRYF